MYRLAQPHFVSSALAGSKAHLPVVVASRHMQQPNRAVHASSSSASGSLVQNLKEAPKAALMVIGDEILSGSVVDSNTPWLAKLLYSRGVDLIRVEYVPDCRKDISESVLKLKERVGPNGFVFTSGGIGPTHDDVTYEAIAAAFGAELRLHEPTIELMKVHFGRRGVPLNESRLRMALLPHPADEVLFTPELWVPLVNLHNVFILPGIPRLFTAMMSAHQEKFSGPAHHQSTLYTRLGEGDLALALAEVAKKHPGVNIGSYPNVKGDNEVYKVKMQFSSRDEAAVAKAVEEARAVIGQLGPVFDSV